MGEGGGKGEVWVGVRLFEDTLLFVLGERSFALRSREEDRGRREKCDRRGDYRFHVLMFLFTSVSIIPRLFCRWVLCVYESFVGGFED